MLSYAHARGKDCPPAPLTLVPSAVGGLIFIHTLLAGREHISCDFRFEALSKRPGL